MNKRDELWLTYKERIMREEAIRRKNKKSKVK
jgi:hypothetical protein